MWDNPQFEYLYIGLFGSAVFLIVILDRRFGCFLLWWERCENATKCRQLCIEPPTFLFCPPKIIVDLHPYETRWLPIQLFVGKNACSLAGSLKTDREQRRHERESHLNILHISLQATLSANKLLQKYNLLLGQFIQIPNVLDVKQKVGLALSLLWSDFSVDCLTNLTTCCGRKYPSYRYQNAHIVTPQVIFGSPFPFFCSPLQLPLKLTPMAATKHCRLEDCKADGCCGTLWLKVDSGAFWDAWFHDSSASRCPGPQSLVAQLCIEFAADVAPATTQEENWTRVVIGRRVRVGIEIRFLTSLDAPIRILSPQLRHEVLAPDKSTADCTFQFKLESVLSPELSVRVSLAVI